MIAGRPVRFVAMIVTGWTAMRMILVLPTAFGGPGGPANQPLPRIAAGPVQMAGFLPTLTPPSAARPSPIQTDNGKIPALMIRSPAPVALSMHASAGGWTAKDADSLLGAQLAFAQAPRAPTALALFAPGAGYAAVESGIPGRPPHGAQAGRWSGAAWILWRRDGASAPLARSGRLGGSQAGLRVDYALDPASPMRPALYGRVSGALNQPLALEAAAGVALRPVALPVTLAVERRAALSSGGRNDFALIAAAGIDRQSLTHGLRIDGYGQAGIVGLHQTDAFADGRLTVESLVSDKGLAGNSDIAIGAALWGGAQPGIARLDIGPQASIRLPVGTAHIRLSTEWRQRIAGEALPASGPAITIGLDF